MATGTAQPTVVPPPPPAAAEHERIIQRKLGRTSLHVRLVDLAAALALWIVGVLGFLLVAALIDHWLPGGLGIVGRVIALVAIGGGSLWFLVTHVGPLLVRRINATYAARTIEEATPSLKNSLINFLLLKQDHRGIKEVVYQAVEEKAASDIASVPVEATVDRSRLIRAGYVLCAVMAVFAAYKILSPKDPFQTIARVALPWADIARPSRVEISDVLPGNSEVYLGQTVEVSALVSGVREGDPVTLIFSTEDGQTVDRPLSMALDKSGLRYQCTLPPPDDALVAVASGLQQDVTYRIVAGDAETSQYKLAVVAAPTIIVERLEFQYPAYTKKQPATVPQRGDIKGPEGTKVTVHAVANQPIKTAWLELDPNGKGGQPERVQLASDGSKAWGTVTLLLKPDRQTAWRSSYQVLFYNERGQRSQQPTVHKIEVIRDLPPEVQILQPERVKVEVPENGQQRIEVRGVDPDYGLSRLWIEGKVAGQPAIEIDLLQDDAGQPPQATREFMFRPAEHKLKAGDVLRYVAVAEDNRTSPLTGKPEANVARTSEHTIVIAAPTQAEQANDPNQRPMPGEQNAEQPQQGEPKEQQPQQGDKPPMAGDKSDMNPPRESDQEKPKNQPMQGEAGEQGDKQEGKQQGEKQQGQKGGQGDKSQQGEQQQGEKQQGENQKGENQQGGQPMQGGQGDKSQGENQQGEEQQGGQQNQGQSSGAKSGGQRGSQSGNPQDAQPMNEDGQPAGAGQGGTRGQQPSGNSDQQSGQEGDPNADASGQPTGAGRQGGKAHEGELVEEVLKDIEKQGGQGQNNSQRGQDDKDQEPGAKGQEPGAKGQEPEGQGQQPMPGDGASSGNDPREGSQQRGKSGTKADGAHQGAKPGGNDQKPEAGDQRKPGQGEKVDPQDRLPGDKQGQNPSEQKSGGNEGGQPEGPSKTDKGEQSKAGQGERKDPGAGQNGDEGAGANSDDKTGSGQGQEANRDTDKTMQPDGSKAEKGEVSPPSISKKQSDSKGGESGNESGGGKKGAGQSAGQEGNDSAGSKSAADQGAGKANETGSGEKGSKAGGEEKAESQTGESGAEKGDGSRSQAGPKGTSSGKAGAPPKGPTGDKPSDPMGDSDRPGKGGSAGPVVGGGADSDRQKIDPMDHPEAERGDEANLEYARKATEMVLQHLKDQEHNPDPELLDKMGWSKDDLAEFLRRWESLQKSADDSPDGKRELDEALKSLGLRDPANRKRSGGTTSDDQRGLRDSGNRSAPPPTYRDLFDAFRKGAARSQE
jgi:hypothetical protein